MAGMPFQAAAKAVTQKLRAPFPLRWNLPKFRHNPAAAGDVKMKCLVPDLVPDLVLAVRIIVKAAERIGMPTIACLVR